jgi:hypothetical protein
MILMEPEIVSGSGRMSPTISRLVRTVPSSVV